MANTFNADAQQQTTVVAPHVTGRGINLNDAAPQRTDDAPPVVKRIAPDTAAERYVKTDAIKTAVRGHEQAVLHAVEIDWSASRSHIRCPYPGHDDKNPSWRWDAQQCVAYCICIGRNGGPNAHSIFDIVMAVGGLDFEASKLRVAEIIGRGDLIHEKRSNQNRQYQKQDPASLLSPPSDNRDDALVWNYLGHRLGIPPDQVPRPATTVVGIKQLPYYDPPKTKGLSR